MTDFPIIFSAPMVRALLDGRKTMTRRLAWNENRLAREMEVYKAQMANGMHLKVHPTIWQKVRPGDRIWVKENFCVAAIEKHSRKPIPIYAADHRPVDGSLEPIRGPKWKSSRFMPRKYSRLTLVVTATRMERLQKISEADASAEGIVRIWRSLYRHGRMDGYGLDSTPPESAATTARNAFWELWDNLHGPGSWDADPDVVALTFTVHKANIDKMVKAA